MKRTLSIIAAAAAVASISAPAFADFWVVRDSPAAECRVVETRPADTKITIVGNKVYKTRDEATKEMAVACKK